MADRPLPPFDRDAATALVDHGPALLGIAVDPAWREDVMAHMVAIGQAAQRVLERPLADEDEAAPVYRP